MNSLPSDWLKFVVMTPLQMQVVELDVCSRCHKKTLVHRITNELGQVMQCSVCNTAFIRNPQTVDGDR